MRITLTREEAFELLSKSIPKELAEGMEIASMSQSYSGAVEIELIKKGDKEEGF